MNKKTFKVAPTPKRLTEEVIKAFEKGGVGHDPKYGSQETKSSYENEPRKRISVDVPASIHRRFKTVCSATSRKMADEIQQFIERRIGELEVEVGISPMNQSH